MNEPGHLRRLYSESTTTSAASGEPGDISRGAVGEDPQPQLRTVETRLLYRTPTPG